MKDVYKRIWELAKPYYKRGRAMDLDHVQWMMKDAVLICKKEKIDESIFLPLVILHDIGYADIKDYNFHSGDIRRTHMDLGKTIAKTILEKVNYSMNKIKRICYYISVHDNWALGDKSVYEDDKLLSAFTDLDFTWMAAPKGFAAFKKLFNKTSKEMIEYLESRETPLNGIPFSTKTALSLYEKYLNDRKHEI